MLIGTHRQFTRDHRFSPTASAEVEGTITPADEVLTSDSSRYWDAAARANGQRRDSFDKQMVVAVPGSHILYVRGGVRVVLRC